VRACTRCLQAGNIDARLEKRAQMYEALAADTRALIGALILPSYEEWKARTEEADRAYSERNPD
jgi:hypothetical protein